ncbi:MAG: hypothetical protein HYU76_07365 [Betaproteobacteria bacterium]|nr:hypothetical protein [Betaproteobacteria bacterium]
MSSYPDFQSPARAQPAVALFDRKNRKGSTPIRRLIHCFSFIFRAAAENRNKKGLPTRRPLSPLVPTV